MSFFFRKERACTGEGRGEGVERVAEGGGDLGGREGGGGREGLYRRFREGGREGGRREEGREGRRYLPGEGGDGGEGLVMVGWE